MELTQQALGSAAFFFILPWLIGAAILVPFAGFIWIARKIQSKRLQQSYKELGIDP